MQKLFQNADDKSEMSTCLQQMEYSSGKCLRSKKACTNIWIYCSLPEKGWDTSSKENKDVKGLGGKGRLTDAKTDTLQNYFGIALRQNVWDILKIISAYRAVMAIVQKNQNSGC